MQEIVQVGSSDTESIFGRPVVLHNEMASHWYCIMRCVPSGKFHSGAATNKVSAGHRCKQSFTPEEHRSACKETAFN